MEPRRITIAGKRESKSETKDGESVYTEECSDEIFRAIELPAEVSTTNVSATLKDGVLEVQIPKAESRKSDSKKSQTA